MELKDYVDLEYLKALQDSFSAAVGISVAIVNHECVPITKSIDWDKDLGNICVQRNTEDGCCSVVSDITNAGNKRDKGGVFFNDESEFVLASVPIMANDICMGSWIMGKRIKPAPDAAASGDADENPKDGPRRSTVTLDAFKRAFSLLNAINISLVNMIESGSQLKDREKELNCMITQMDGNNKILRTFLNSSVVAMHVTDYYTGEIIMANQRYCDVVGCTLEEMLGKKCWDVNNIVSETTFCSDCPRRRLLDENGKPLSPVTWTIFNEKFKTWMQCTNQVMEWGGRGLVHIVTMIDVTKEIELRKELSNIAFYDSQTSLPNGQKLIQDFRGLTKDGKDQSHSWNLANGCFFYEMDTKASGAASSIDIVSFELSGLRSFNDSYGRDASCDLLITILEWCREYACMDADLYRIERDEFCFMLIGADQHAVMEIASYINNRFVKPWYIDVNGQTISYFCSVSVSVIFATREGIIHDDILRLISSTLDAARKNKNIVVYDEEMHKLEKEHLVFELSLKNCVNNDMAGFEVYYQPIVEISSGTWIGVEALCRWTSPEMGIVSPVEFIPKAESIGLISAIGLWVLETAIKQCSEFGLPFIDGFFLSVNMSPLQLMDERFAEDVIRILKRNGYPGKCLNLEVTESVELTFNSFTISIIERLRGHGVKIALDDFGTGYSTFNNLRNLPLNFIKTECEFVKWVERDNYMRYFFHIISEISHANNMSLIAEGIETKEQLEIIQSNGADYIQGYFFSKPMSAKQLSDKIERFTHRGEEIALKRSETDNIGRWLNEKKSCVVTPSIFKLLNTCMFYIMSEIGKSSGYSMALEAVASHFGVGGTFVFIRQNDKFNLLHKWCDENAFSPKKLFADEDTDNIAQSVLTLLRMDSVTAVSGIDQLPYEIHDTLAEFGIGSIAIMPIRNGDDIDGFIGFFDANQREWSPDEIIMLWNLCIMTSGYAKMIKFADSDAVNSCRISVIKDIMNNAGFKALAADIETREILWVNDTLKSKFTGNNIPKGMKCYEVMSDREDRCPICFLDETAGGDKSCSVPFEFNNTHCGRSLVVYDGLVEWENGKKAHIELVLDTTEHNMTQEQLDYFAAVDPLTGTLNRNALFARMRRALAEALAEGSKLSIAFVNVDRLRFVNEKYGHSAGDMVLNNIVKALRTYIRGNDILGRVWGDKFVIVFPSCDKNVAMRRMTQAKNHLIISKIPLIVEKITFSYGIVQNNELSYTNESHYVDELLNLANQRMIDNKNLTTLCKKAV
jgi:diguanylate cyclase (GGDEF)-like protein/PAS domain S-box-containing protein